jgi:nucleotidyltransferase/DNA polymerase involved in DNA repair
MPRIACLFVPDFRLQVALSDLGDEPEGGLALVDPDDGRRLIVAASPSARLDGVKRGMSAIAAGSIAPELVVREVDVVALELAHRGLEDAIRSVTPSFETTGGGVVYAAFDGLERTYEEEGEGGFLDELRRIVRLLGLPARVGIAGTRFAARAAAVLEGKLTRYGPGPISVPTGEEVEFLAPLPLELLPDALDEIAALKKLGVRSLGGFAALPPGGVARRFGLKGTALHRLARGVDRATLVPCPEPREWAVTTTAEYPIVQTEALRFLLKEPLARLVGSLDAEGLSCGVLHWRMTIDGEDPMELITRSAAPSASLRLWMDLVKVELERLVLPAGVLSVTLEADEVAPRPSNQERLTGPRAAPPGALSLTLAHLAAELGPEDFGVLLPRAAVFAEEREELAVEGGMHPSGRRLKPNEAPVPDVARTGELPCAFRRVEPPERVELELRRGTPVGFRHRGGWMSADRAVGPWDSSTGWWEAERRRRTWQIEGRGSVAQVSFDPDRAGWFLEGWLD